MKILLVINPSAGKTSNDKAILRVHELAVEKGFDFKFIYTIGKNDNEKIQSEIATYRPNRVIAEGGDGTVQLVAKNILGKNLHLGIIPLGSANGMATALGSPQIRFRVDDKKV